MVQEFIHWQLILLLISFFANYLSALSGGGAGLIQLPALILLGLPFPIALATHKVASVALGFGAGIRHFQSRSLRIGFSLFILSCGLPGVFLGTRIILNIPSQVSNLFLGLITLSIGIVSLASPKLGRTTQTFIDTNFNWFLGGFVIFLIGFLNGSFSSGTGLFVTLWLVKWFGLNYAEAVAYTLILVGLCWNATGALLLGFQEQIFWSWIPVLVTGSMVGGYLGAQTSILKGAAFVKKSCEFLSLVMGLSLIAKSILP